MLDHLAVLVLLSVAALLLARIVALIVDDQAVIDDPAPHAGWESHLDELDGLFIVPPDLGGTRDLTQHYAYAGPGAYLGRHHEDTVELVPAAWRPGRFNPAFEYVRDNWPRGVAS
jgi:hypothetical protein